MGVVEQSIIKAEDTVQLVITGEGAHSKVEEFFSVEKIAKLWGEAPIVAVLDGYLWFRVRGFEVQLEVPGSARMFWFTRKLLEYRLKKLMKGLDLQHEL